MSWQVGWFGQCTLFNFSQCESMKKVITLVPKVPLKIKPPVDGFLVVHVVAVAKFVG